MGGNLVFIIKRFQVSKRKHWEPPKERSGLRWKKMQIEVELELESDGSREDGCRVWGQDISFGLMGLQYIVSPQLWTGIYHIWTGPLALGQ